MALPNELHPLQLGAGSASGYQIGQSLRFSTDEYLTRTNSTASTDGQYGTLSVWYKMDSTTASSQLRTIIEGRNGTYGHMFRFYTNKTDLHIGVWGSIDGGAYSAADFRDDSAWYHFLWQFDKTQSGVTNVNKLWVNGVAQSQTSAGTFSSQNWGITNNGSDIHIGHYQGSGSTQSARLKGYIAEMHVVDGALKAATDFGEYDDNGVWRPIKYTGTYGNNGFYLKFDPSAVNGIGHDHSGNGNNFTPYNFLTSGTGTDVMSDTPTTNWCTLNPIGSTTTGGLSEGNLNYYNGTTAVWRSGVSTFAVSSGKWYFEAKFTSFPAGGRAFVGIGPDTVQWVSNASHFGQGSASGSYGYYSYNGQLYTGGFGSSYGATYTTNDVIGVALDLDAGTLRFYKNGVDQGEAVSGLTGTWNFGVSSLDTPAVVNFGQRAFEQTPPTGFKALNTSNLPAPDIADGSVYFNTVLYNGNGSTQTISGVGFQPDLIYVKARSTAQGPSWYNAISGFNKILMSTTSTNGDTTDTGGLNGVTSDGFTLDGNNAVIGGTNGSGQTYVAWNWLAGNGTSSNTDGSITSTVSANPTAGFSIATFTGNGSTATFGHGLGVAPRFVIVKKRAGGTMGAGYSDWLVYSQAAVDGGAGSDAFYYLNSTAGTSNSSSVFSGAPTSTIVNIGNNQIINNSGSTFVAYCFAEVEGYSKFGRYTGNGSDDGPFVYCGFRPAWIMIRSTSASRNWAHVDSTRSYANVANHTLAANRNDGESYYGNGESVFGSLNKIDLLSNGFKPRENATWANGSGETYIFAAFAENPFGGSGVSPATAR